MSKTYKNIKVLDNVSIDLDIGEVVGLLGPNGAGKTTCFYIIAGLIKPDYGKVNIGKTDITGYPVYERARIGLGYLPQEMSIFKGLSVEDNLLSIISKFV